MPKDKVEAAIKKASGQGAANYDVILYEGYGPHGIAMLVEAATDNVTRTVANVRHHFKAHGGNMGTTGSVAFMFQRQGVFRLEPEGLDRDDARARADRSRPDLARRRRERQGRASSSLVRCAFSDFGTMQARDRGPRADPDLVGVASTSPPDLTELPEDKLDEVMELVAALEGDDDVQNVYTNLA